jgi:plastocyanin
VKIHKPKVDVGKTGWDKSFGKTGDSWFTGEKRKGTKNTRKVSAAVGTTLYFMCAVHPGMQGKIKVVE